MRAAWLIALLSVLAAPASAKRVALLVAHPFGGDELLPLRYTANDLERMRQVLETWGGFEADDVIVSFGESADDVMDRFADAKQRSRGAGNLFVFYYSGHAKDGELRLGDTRLALADVKRLTEETGAELRLAVIDACRSGSITRLKGAQKGAPIDVGVEDQAAQRGQVLITASSEHEDAQESDDIQGSFFTYFFTAGLRGAGDANGDGKVSLSEAYNHAYGGTVLATLGSKGGVQHPSYRFDLRGAGDVVLTEIGSPDAAVVFPSDVEGRFVVFDLERQVVVAELDKRPGEVTSLAVAPGAYVVKKRETSHLEMQRVRAVKGSVVRVDPSRMERVAFADDYAKGAVVTVDDARHGKVGVRLSLGVGQQAFLSAPARRDYFPNIGMFVLQVDLENFLRRGLGLRFDFGFGQSGEYDLVLDDPYVGELSYPVNVGQLTGGMAVTAEVPSPVEWLKLGAQFRVGGLLLTRRFQDRQVPNQAFSTVTPGIGGEAGVMLTDWLSAGLSLRLHYMFFNMDKPQSLAYVDGGLVVTAVLR